mgnify:CR=1 FL=1
MKAIYTLLILLIPFVGFARLKKLEKKALDEVENESIRRGFEYEIIKIFRHKQSFGILPKVEVLIEIQ